MADEARHAPFRMMPAALPLNVYDAAWAQPRTWWPSGADCRPGRPTGPLRTSNSGRWSLGSIGVVYGDIGTSPLYAFREAVMAAKGASFAGREAVFGVLSLIVWALLLIVTLKYVLILLRADNKGEGGTFALMALGQSVAKRSAPVIMGLGIAGASFFYGDAVITPAISVLSAVEGLKLVSPAFGQFVIPLSVVILVGLFAMQSRGTAQCCGILRSDHDRLVPRRWSLGGLPHIVDNPDVLVALNPWYGVTFVLKHGLRRPDRARPRLPRRHRCRSALRRPRPLRPQADPGGLVLRSCCRRCSLNYFGQGALRARAS